MSLVARHLEANGIATVILGSACAALLNAASNCINQYYDLVNDRRNKPNRPLVTGAISMRAGLWFSIALYVLAVAPTWLVVTYPRNTISEKLFAPLPEHQCIVIYVLGMLATFIYSAPAWGRIKANAFLANLTIAIPRGCLLKVAGWSMGASVFHLQPQWAQNRHITESELKGRFADARVLEAIHKAAKWDALQSGKAAAVSKAQAAPPVVKPGASKGPGAAAEQKT